MHACIHSYIHLGVLMQVCFAPDRPESVLPARMEVVLEVSKRPPRIVVELDPATGKQKVKKVVD